MSHNALGCHIYAGGFTLGIECRVGQSNWNVSDFRGKVDLVYTNPPCAGWSQAGGKVIDKPEVGHKKYETFELTSCTLRCSTSSRRFSRRCSSGNA